MVTLVHERFVNLNKTKTIPPIPAEWSETFHNLVIKKLKIELFQILRQLNYITTNKD